MKWKRKKVIGTDKSLKLSKLRKLICKIIRHWWKNWECKPECPTCNNVFNTARTCRICGKIELYHLVK